MGVPTSEVGYTPAMPRREDHEVHKGHVVALDQKKLNFYIFHYITSSPEDINKTQYREVTDLTVILYRYISLF
jgi:hypothetical protein